ncbi:universal stress protein [Marivita hallyeonensis]|uniref:Nucleotide-binding universal stress protein, UspA family n=1 Tax=Marivita hallyeonensis TaxID=996342 RepID=A0A1M5RTN6_9RHOB|nr:universal stress protein [Marivita hallyeonensis]SHH29672.1 Nucleotide-binding universal stress protein, UspA family [Marivita hallyeonensis]
MYNKILVPMALDHGISPQSLQVARVLAGGTGRIVALHVYEMPQGTVSAYVDEDVIKAGFANAKTRMDEKLADVEDVTPVLIQGHSARTIIDYATDNAFDCIVIGSHKPGLSDFFLGSTAARVVRHAPCAVHVVRDSA